MEPLEFKANDSVKQFFNLLLDDSDQLNNFVFDVAINYRSKENYLEAIKWFKFYTILKDPIDEQLYFSFIELGILHKILQFDSKKVINFFNQAIALLPDRHEAYYHLGLFYNQTKNYQSTYDCLINAMNLKQKKFLYDELSVACYWLGRYSEGMDYLLQILHDPDFKEIHKRLLENERFFKEKLLK